MAENMFEIRKNDRRKQIIAENLDVADQIIATNPNSDIIQDEKVFEEAPEKEEIVLEKEEEFSMESEEINDIVLPNLLDFKKKESDKGRYTYYLDNEIDELLILVSKKFDMKSKSILANLLLGTTILLNENIQVLSENDREINESFMKLFNKFKKK